MLIHRRKHKRYRVKGGIVAFSTDDVFTLKNISEGGAAVTCIGKNDFPSSFSLEILMKSNNFKASFPVKLVWEKTIEVSPNTLILKKCLGVKFEKFTEENVLKIRHLISNYH